MDALLLCDGSLRIDVDPEKLVKRVLFGQLVVLWRDGLARASRSGQVSPGAAADEGDRSERTLHLRASRSRSRRERACQKRSTEIERRQATHGPHHLQRGAGSHQSAAGRRQRRRCEGDGLGVKVDHNNLTLGRSRPERVVPRCDTIDLDGRHERRARSLKGRGEGVGWRLGSGGRV